MLMLHKRLPTTLAALLIAASLGACSDDDPLGPEDVERADVVGTYDMTALTATESGIPVNLLSLGSDLEITLASDGTTEGRLLIPGLDEDGGDLDADLAGTYTFDEETREVTFQQEADTFLRDLTLVAVRSGNRILLEGSESFGSASLSIVLTRR